MSAWSNSTDVRTQRARVVVQELRGLVEERGVVLVALDHEVRARALAEAAVEVERDARRRAATDRGPLRSSSDATQARRGGLAVRAARPPPSACPRSRARRARRRTSGRAAPRRSPRAPRGCRGARRCRSRRGRARRASTCSARKPSATGMPQPLEQRAHRRVELVVGAGHAQAARVQQAREASPCPVPPIATKWTRRGVSSLARALRSAREGFRITRSCTIGRSSNGCFLATWCTRLVSITTIASRSRSIQSDVPVKPRCPIERAEKCWPDDGLPRRRRVPAERPVRARRAAAGASLKACERRARQRVAAAVPDVEHGLREAHHVVGGGEEARVARDAAHRPRVRVVHLAPDDPLAPRAVLGRGDAPAQRLGRARRPRRAARRTSRACRAARTRARAQKSSSGWRVTASTTAPSAMKSRSPYTAASPGSCTSAERQIRSITNSRAAGVASQRSPVLRSRSSSELVEARARA